MYAQVMTTFAGKAGVLGFSGDGGPALNAVFNEPVVGAIDNKGNVYIADDFNERVRKINVPGIITTIAGNGHTGFSGDGSPAISATFNGLTGIAVDGNGFIYISDAGNARIRKVDTLGIISTFAGNNTFGYSGDGGAATLASLDYPTSITADIAGNIFFADGSRIRKINTSGIISTVAGNGDPYNCTGDGSPAIDAGLGEIGGIAVDSAGNLFISEFVYNCIRKVNTLGIINLYAGTEGVTIGSSGFSGNGGPATNALMLGPAGLAIGRNGNLYICDDGNNVIRIVSLSGIINTFAGTDTVAGYSGDGGLATNAKLFGPNSLAIDSSGNVYIGERGNNIVRKVIINGVASVNNINNGAKPIDIFPNPVLQEDNLHINGLQSVYSYSLITTAGTEIQTGNLQPGDNTITLNDLPPAVYLLEITDSHGQKTITKLIKQ
jgi:hypothetical protein